MPLVLEPADVQEPPYQGRAGATRIDNVHVQMPDGTFRTVTIHRGVNVGTDPHLREVALSGALHRLEPGVELAIPFVYHDPAARKLVLVIPEPLRHEEIRERARLLEMIANDTTVPVPRYAGEAATVVGIRALREYLERVRVPSAQADADLSARRRELSLREEAIAHREQQLAQREQSLLQREQRIRERAEDVTRREDELSGLAEEHEAARRDLAIREQELEQRLESLVQREQALAERERALSGRTAEPDRGKSDGVSPGAFRSSRPPSAPPPAPASSIVVGPGDASATARPTGATGLEEVAHEDDIEEIDELEPIRTNPAAVVESLDVLARGTAIADAMALVADDVEEIADDDVEEEVEEHDLASAEDEDREAPRTVIANAHNLIAAGPPRPPELRDEVEMVVRANEGVELFVALGDRLDAFEDAELLIQLVVVEGAPVVVFALVDHRGGRPVVRRAALDPRTGSVRRVLEMLRRRFEARTFFFGPDGNYVRSGRVSAAREPNVARIIDRVARLGQGGPDGEIAIERVLAAPPPVVGSHPFGGEEEGKGPDTAAQVAAALAELTEWASQEKMDHAMLVLSVPRDAIDATFARVLERAVEHGLAIPASLLDRALGAGLAADVSALVTRQVQAFRATVERPDAGGLDAEAIAANWERLLAAAGANEVAIDSETHDVAWRAIRAVRGEQTGSTAVGPIDPARLEEMSTAELVILLEHPRHRCAAAIALCERRDPNLADVLCKAVRKMPRNEVVRVVPRITRIGEEVGDALIDGLSARKTFVRQAFALALGHLRLRRAVVPLLHLLASEPSDVWREIARIYGSFGNASFRTLVQKLSDPKGPEDRYVLALAHLANHGCVKQVEALADDKDGRVAAMVKRALQARDEARAQSEVVGGERPLGGADPVAAFSRRFLQELEGAAPDSDLPGEDT